MSSVLKAHLALFTVNLIYGANYIVAKGVMPNHVGPSGFIAIRVLGALALFWGMMAFIKEKVARKDLLRLAICGLFGVCLNQLLFFEGLNLTTSVDAAIIMTFNPILVLVLASIMLKEKITGYRLGGVAIGMTGAILLILYNVGSGEGLDPTLGNLFIFLNAMSYGLYLVLVKPLMSKYKPVTVISYVFLFGTIGVLLSPFAVQEFVAIEWNTMPTDMLWSVGYVVVATTFLAYLLNIFALKIVSPSVSSSYIYLQPVMSMFFTWIYGAFLYPESEAANFEFTWLKGVFTLMIFTGVFLISRRPVAKSGS